MASNEIQLPKTVQINNGRPGGKIKTESGEFGHYVDIYSTNSLSRQASRTLSVTYVLNTPQFFFAL